jgi:hypothetical protein
MEWNGMEWNGWMDGWMDVRRDGWMEEGMEGCTRQVEAEPTQGLELDGCAGSHASAFLTQNAHDVLSDTLVLTTSD